MFALNLNVVVHSVLIDKELNLLRKSKLNPHDLDAIVGVHRLRYFKR